MNVSDEAALSRRLLAANKALAEAIRGEKKLVALVEVERSAEREQERLAKEALQRGDEAAAHAALQAKRRRGKERACHEDLVRRQRQGVARCRVAASSLRDELSELRDEPAVPDGGEAFRLSAWMQLVGTLPERALAKASTKLLLNDEHALRNQLRAMLSLAAELERACILQRARLARRQERVDEAQSEATRWKQRAGLAARANEDGAAKALLMRHRTWTERAESQERSLHEAQQRLAAHQDAAAQLGNALAAARQAVPHAMAGLGQ